MHVVTRYLANTSTMHRNVYTPTHTYAHTHTHTHMSSKVFAPTSPASSVDLLIAGTRGSHAMVVVLDEAGMVALKPPVVVQECRNHGAKLFKVE